LWITSRLCIGQKLVLSAAKKTASVAWAIGTLVTSPTAIPLAWACSKIVVSVLLYGSIEIMPLFVLTPVARAVPAAESAMELSAEPVCDQPLTGIPSIAS
jgi:hypothetical protein